MKRIICVFLAIVSLLSLLSGCAGDGEITTGRTEASSLPETESETVYLDLSNGEELLYKIIRPDIASETIKDALRTLTNAFGEKLGRRISGETDWVKGNFAAGEYERDAPEILIGETNRLESKAVYLTLEPGEMTVQTVGNKIVILGYNDVLTLEAAKAFADMYITAAETDVLRVPEGTVIKGSLNSSGEEKPEVMVENITPQGERISASAQTWVACEIELISEKDYTDPVYTVDTDVIFYNKETGEALSIPAFWDGRRSWKVRFAPTSAGEWEFYTKCTDTENKGLHHRAGVVSCSEYSGELDIYKHGFVKTEYGKSYFVYDDGTPFFYLGDTHWTLALEEIDSYGSVETQGKAGITEAVAQANGITSQFKYIMDYRAEQGYTVIQSQPLGWWTNPGQNGWFADEYQNIFTYGVNDIMLEKFRQYDRYFAYIAEKGFVHANSQFGYPTALMTEYFAGNISDEELEKLCRYWVARYGAYPVMWTTTQEGDNDYYGVDRGDCAATPETNPWLKVIDYIDKYDVYDHPTTCHQEHWSYTSVENSTFGKLDSHDWYAAQYSTALNSTLDWDKLREYYNNPGSKPVVNYEGRYDHFWTGTVGARAQGWITYMNGQTGYGYGVQPIWSIFWAFHEMTEFTAKDESEEYSTDLNWLDGLRSEGGAQVAYIKRFLSDYEWWKLVPCFNGSYFYDPNGKSYSVSHIGDKVFIGYFYNTIANYEKFGTFTSMANGEYEVKWFNCRSGEYSESFKITVTDGTYTLPAKPDSGDWAISAVFIG